MLEKSNCLPTFFSVNVQICHVSHTVSKEFRHKVYKKMTAEGLAAHLNNFLNAHTKLILTLAMEIRMEIACEAEVLYSCSQANQKSHSVYFSFQKIKCFV